METFEGKQTNWEGLWWHPEYNGYSSAALNLDALKGFDGTVRLYVRKNKFYNCGENGRPNYNFCIKAANSDTFTDVTVEDDERVHLCDKIEELRDVMARGRRNGDYMALPSDSQAMAATLMKRAIELVEEITGEQWEFSYITY